MAALPPMSSVHDAMIACGVDNTAANEFEGRTQAARVATDIFFDSFETVARKSMKELTTEFKTYTSLTAANGRIPLNPGIQNRIKAFVQWTRDEIRLGRNPSSLAYITGNEPRLLERMREHDLYIKESPQLAPDAKPEKFTNDDDWEDFDRKFQSYLRLIPGSNGVPLQYVIRENAASNPMPQPDYLDEYINAAPLMGTTFITDNQKVYVLFQALITHEQALSVIATQNTTTNGRDVYLAVKAHFEGSGIMQNKVTNAEKTIRQIRYKGEIQPYMWWTKFEQELLKAHSILDTDAGRQVYNESMRIRQLQDKIQCDWLVNHKATVDAEIAKIPMRMTFATALTIYRNAVNAKYPPGTSAQKRGGRRGISEVGRGRGHEGPRNHGGRGRGGRGGRGRRGGIRNHPEQETIVLRNRQQIQYHPSYLFTREEINQMTQGQKDRLNRERAEYRQPQGLPPRRSRQEREQQIQTLISEVATLRSNQEQMSTMNPPESIEADQQTRISQVTIGTAGSSIIGGRNQQARQRQQRYGDRH